VGPRGAQGFFSALPAPQPFNINLKRNYDYAREEDQKSSESELYIYDIRFYCQSVWYG
jgi:hypothetical protein